jgi:hypothetical protein
MIMHYPYTKLYIKITLRSVIIAVRQFCVPALIVVEVSE